MNLTQELELLKQKSAEGLAEESKYIMKQAAQDLLKQEIEKKALGKGDRIPQFTLKNATGKEVDIYQLLSIGPLIINFYRGAWCPYCNLELKAYKELLPEIKKRGANLVAISPETPDNSAALSRKLSIGFEVLSDINNEVARKFGLVFKLKEDLISLYKGFGIDLSKSQGNNSNELPVPATYAAGKNGIILLAYINSDYTKRLEPMDALDAIT